MTNRRNAKKVRLDILLQQRRLVQSREAGRRLVMAGQVQVEGQNTVKPGQLVAEDARIVIVSRPRFVSRGGDKLAAALLEFAISPVGWACADVGASTGGFSDCLLQAGARLVYAIDVGYGQLSWSLRQDARVVVMERVNARYLDTLPEPVDLACIDASFISLKLLIPVVHRWLKKRGQLIALVKPQFEAGRESVGKGGVVRSPDVHAAVLRDVLQFSLGNGMSINGLIPSPIKGPSGNIEFLLWLANDDQVGVTDIPRLIDTALDLASKL